MVRTPSPDAEAAGGMRGDAGGDPNLLLRLKEELSPEFHVLRRIGEEAFCSLYLAREPALSRSVVVKVLAKEAAPTPQARHRFERSGLAVARISHPNVMPIFRVGTLEDGTPYYVEPYLGECTLGERLSALGRFPPDQVRPVMAGLAGALAAAHQQGIVHRGLHPGAVRCEEASGRAVITDFGLAGLLDSAPSAWERLTPTGEVLGSAGYMSPEQLGRSPATDRSDIYALGLIAWRLLSGPGPGIPGPGNHSEERWDAWEESVGDPDLTDLIRRCLAENPHDRPSAEDVAAHLAMEPGRRESGHRDEGFWSGVVRRRIPHALLIYAPAMWVGLQVTDQLVQQELLPRVAYLLMLVTAVAGLPAALVIAWYHGPRGRQRVPSTERWILAAIATGWVTALVVTWLRAGAS